jgi:UPF0755 protein
MLPEFEIKETRRSGKKIFLLALFLIIIISIVFLLFAYIKIHKPSSSESAPVTFSVPKGASTKDVGISLQEKDLVSSTYLFVVYALFEGANGKIQAGDYLLDRNMSMADILNSLTSGKVTRNEKRITIVEGATNKQIENILKEKGLVTSNSFQSALSEDYDFDYNDLGQTFSFEGFLFPDTYTFDANYTAEDIVSRMLKNFESKITDQMLADMQKKNLSMKEVIILASIIEREVGRSSSVKITDQVKATMQKEREYVASVFYNRLEIGMALQSDATVNYITGKNDRRANLEDIKVNSPYNTYVVKGLPPGPISNPGLDSIRAAIYAPDTDYLYFLSDPNGVAYFGRTLEEHNANRQKYLD